MWLNGTCDITQGFDAANQVAGWSSDAAGNLTNDGSTSYAYDALNRLLEQDRTVHRYNGDGVLIATDGITYTQDLAAPLSQILNDGATEYFSGLDRLANAAGTWELHDALGSVRLTVDADGSVLHSTTYDPWGQIETGRAAPCGFTGELQQDDLVYLRARWYDSRNGTFTTQRWRTNESWDTIPYSHHPYQYGYSNPVLNTDPSGKYVLEVRYKWLGWFVRNYYHAYIVVTDKDGAQYYWRGGPSQQASNGFIFSASSGSSSQSSSASSNQSSGSSDSGNSSNSCNSTSPGSGPGGAGQNTGPWGPLTTQYGRYVQGTVDWQTTPDASLVVVKNNEAFDKFKELNASMDRIRNEFIPYNPLSTSSNAVAHQGIEDIGFPRPISPVWAPGSDVKV